jgi:hypothetical protein
MPHRGENAIRYFHSLFDPFQQLLYRIQHKDKRVAILSMRVKLTTMTRFDLAKGSLQMVMTLRGADPPMTP